MIPVVSIVGKSNSGKTTLIERIIPFLKEKGYRVGAIKHDVHGFDIDYEGKDTWRMAVSGADIVTISSISKIAMIKVEDGEKTIDELVEWLFGDVDIVVTEGYKAQDKPKIEVVRFDSILCSPSDNLIAVVDNTPENVSFLLPDEYKGIARLDINEIQKIVDFIEVRFLSLDMLRKEAEF